jgi:hypothetical protein
LGRPRINSRDWRRFCRSTHGASLAWMTAGSSAGSCVCSSPANAESTRLMSVARARRSTFALSAGRQRRVGDICHALVSAGGPPAQVLIDHSAVTAHRCACALFLLQMPPSSMLPQSQRPRAHICTPGDFRRIATRYDRLAGDFLATVCLAETVSDWLFRSLVQVQRVLGTEGVDGSFRLPDYQHT